ncbi:hypothetical protein WDW89_01470 [Deltaproteobacteria bacterium TL4]
MQPPDAHIIPHLLGQQNFNLQEVEKQLQALHQSAAHEAVKVRLEELRPLVESVSEPELREWFKIACLGTCVGFIERNLNPAHPAHQYIYSKIIDDLQSMLSYLSNENINYDPHSMKYQVYDYGIQWVYYLDWELYMSQELY